MATTLLPFRDINLHASSSHYAFTSPSSPNAPTLVVDRPTGDLRLHDGTLPGAKRISSIAGILGMIKLKLDKYIIVITKALPMGRLRGHMVYKVAATEFLPLRERPLHDHDEDTYLALLKDLLRTGPMYFSYVLDLTNSFQRQSQSDASLPMWKRADDRFFWNRFIQSDLIDFSLGGHDTTSVRYGPQPGVDPYILPVMYGMLRITPAKVKSTTFTFALITRRSRHRAGTRYFSRGIDEQGHVSNYNETEQIVILNDATGGLSGFAGGQSMKEKTGDSGRDLQVMAYVQTRGSVPVYWAEVNNLKYTPKLQVRGVETAVDAARKHFAEQIRLYGENYLVNLVNQKGREERVKDAYEQLVRILVSPSTENTEVDAVSSEKIHALEPDQRQKELDRLHYIYFDFHNETKGLQWHRAELLMDRLIDGLTRGGYFRGVEDPGLPGGQLDTRSSQTSVVRTNCMDCLDRTNVVQSMLGRWAVTRQLTDAGVLRQGEAANDDREFEDLFRNIWADNADVVSKSYSGTGALKTDFTRTGKRTRAGMLQDLNNSITRYVKNNLLDGPRQDGFDVFLGTYLPPNSTLGNLQLFLDRRPLIIQSIPYILAAGVFMVLISIFTRRLPDAAVWPLRLFVIFWLAVTAWCARFILGHGMLYVNWPKLNTPAAGSEGYQDAMIKARSDPIVGQFLPSRRHQRGYSNARLGFLEEGKTRIE
ncbi:SacI homology domain-containing protein [Aspergillus pseudonomiae]|uniref:SacI homology domain-containing protein n=1 Tax=Aspergillus pseudonomiae TaxID=1506151 RepID=A0A5N7DDC4_9EURO|nr:SacI homology domain-containing protein [Aspergillus pseudonomiae]KAB8265911.1 SacI homology domain-containing protein [Aspergillus pseudonomiae]KAE8404239.1 SacI homology domain-containing protein [Aspergillus pseudonomiae]